MSIIIRNARVLTLSSGDRPRRGSCMGDLNPLDHADVLIDEGQIVAVGQDLKPPAHYRQIDAAGRVLMPAFVDCHTHACWAGDRLDEWDRKQAGATYLELLEAGGGIMSTVRAVRQASKDQLASLLSHRLSTMLHEGTTTLEIKSGYGLSTEDELKMLSAIGIAASEFRGTIIPTACIGHAIDPDTPDFIEHTIKQTLPAIHEAFPEIAIDAYCEQGAWSVAQCVELFEAAAALGHPLRIHADQFNSLGMVKEAVRLRMVSVDHLEATPPTDLAILAESDTFGVMLPCSGFHVDGRYADGRGFIDAGGVLAIATNCNPGSAPTSSMPMAIALAVRNLGITTAEAIAACTVNAASLLGLTDRGTIEPEARADLILLRHRDERQLGYEFGGNPVDMVICAGQIVTEPE